MQKYIVDAPGLAIHGSEVSGEYRGSGKMRIRTESGSYVFGAGSGSVSARTSGLVRIPVCLP